MFGLIQKTRSVIVRPKLTNLKTMETPVSPVEAAKAWEYFWSNTKIIRFEIGPDGEKRAVRSKTQRIMPYGGTLDFRKAKK